MINQEFESVAAILDAFSDEQSCIDHLELLRWEHFVVSPFDPTSKVYQCPNNTYKCKNTGKYFNVKTGTIFHNSKVALQKWFVAIWLLTEQNKNMTSVALSKELTITQKTAWYIIKRIKTYYGTEKNLLSEHKNASLTPKISKKEKETPTNDFDKKQLVEWLALYQNKK